VSETIYMAKKKFDQAELLDDLEGRRLRGGGARRVVHALLGFEQRHAVSETRAGQRRDGADGTRADDDDVSTGHGDAAIILSRSWIDSVWVRKKRPA